VKPLIIVSFLSLFLGYIMLYQAENVSNSFNIFNEPEANAEQREVLKNITDLFPSYQDQSYQFPLTKDRVLGINVININVSRFLKLEKPIEWDKYYVTKSKFWISLTPEGSNLLAGNKQLHEISRESPYRERIKTIKERCKLKVNNFDKNIDLSRFIYDDKRKVVMCVVPKNACTTWKRFWWHFQGFKDYKNVSTKKLVLSSGNIPRLSKLPKNEAFSRLANYTKFFVQRNPFERLTSAHNSKFTDRTPQNEYKKYTGVRAARILLPKVVAGLYLRRYIGFTGLKRLQSEPNFIRLPEDTKNKIYNILSVQRNGKIDFDLFTKYVLYQNDRIGHRRLDVHWRPQVDLCNPCAVNYDYIVAFENLARDSNRLLRYMQRNEAGEVLMDEVSSVINHTVAENSMNLISNDKKTKLLLLYKKDFDVLGYS